MKYVLSRYVALGIAAFLGTDVLALDYSPSATAVPVPGSGAKIDFLGGVIYESPHIHGKFIFIKRKKIGLH